jgi:uncharacterized protein (UPF0332 family)
MTKFANSEKLIRISKAKKNEIEKWKEGVYLEKETSKTVDDLIKKVVADRYYFAKSILSEARNLSRASTKTSRFVISRYYYAMYHAMRAVVYIHHGGDDFEEHKTLPSKVPQDFPNFEQWSNDLKDARERRNNADYDPYPKSIDYWDKIAKKLEKSCMSLLVEVKKYLLAKGCNIK